MSKGRMEAFSDGVIAIVITVMVLGLRIPARSDLAAMRPLVPQLLSYAVSFVFLGIYWSNHHHLLQAVKQVDGRVLWANLHLLFWLSLVPFATGWVGENHFGPLGVALYGIILFLAAIAYLILTQALMKLHGRDSVWSPTGDSSRRWRVSRGFGSAVPLRSGRVLVPGSRTAERLG